MDHSTNSATPVAATKGSAFKRVLATAITAALAFGGVTAIAAPASAAVTDSVTDGSVTWGFSNGAASWGIETTGDVELVAPVEVPTGVPAFTKASGFTLTDGTGSIAADGTGSLDFEGSVTYSPFAAYGAMTFHSTITLADFELTVDSADRGSLTADVTWVKAASSKTEASRVTVANFDIDSLSTEGGAFELTTAEPDWTGTVTAGKYNGTYADAWPTSFVDALLPLAAANDIPVYFYRTGDTPGNTNKAPLPITASASIATPTVEFDVVTAAKTAGYSIAVTGDGFRWNTKPGDAGIYLGIAPSGGAPGFGSADIGKYAGVAALFGEAKIPNGTFATTVSAATTKLDPTLEYSLYTWQAHTHSNTTQDTETPLDIDFAALAVDPSTTELAISSTSAPAGEEVTLTATVPDAATGTVDFVEGETVVASADIVEGVATATVSTLAVGSHAISAVYAGDVNFSGSTSAATEIVIVKADGTVALKLSRTSGTYGNLVTAAATVAATGKVAFLVDGKTAATATIVNGVAKATLPRTIAAGKHTVVASYLGSDVTNAVKSTSATLTLAKATTAKVTIAGSKFKKNAAPIVKVKVSKLSNGFYPSGSIKVKVNGKVVKTVKLTESKKGVLTIKLPRQKSAIKVQATFKSSSTSVVGNYSSIVKIKLK